MTANIWQGRVQPWSKRKEQKLKSWIFDVKSENVHEETSTYQCVHGTFDIILITPHDLITLFLL